MKTCVYLSYSGLGANLMHLSYCHEVAKKFGPITVLTLCKNFKDVVEDDPLIKEIIFLDRYTKKFIHIFKLSKILKKYKFDNIIIYYPSVRLYLAARLANIDHISIYPLFRKKGLHLVNAAKKLTEKFLNIKNCPTETEYFVKKSDLNNSIKNVNSDYFKIVIGAGSSGPTTRWGAKNFSNLINKLNTNGKYFFYILCGPNEKKIEDEIVSNLNKDNFLRLSDKSLKEVIPFLCTSNLYIGNDSFGSHITAQSGIKSLVILLDSPKSYTDYSKNHHRIIPKGYDISKITHGSNISPDLIKVEDVYSLVKNFEKN
jgi:ADP-heptose:LPS heptosyltransferase